MAKFQKCSRAAQNALAGRSLPTPGLDYVMKQVISIGGDCLLASSHNPSKEHVRNARDQ